MAEDRAPPHRRCAVGCVSGAVVTCPQCTCQFDVLLSISVPETRQQVEFLPVIEHHSVPVDLSPDLSPDSSSVDFSPNTDQPAPCEAQHNNCVRPWWLSAPRRVVIPMPPLPLTVCGQQCAIGVVCSDERGEPQGTCCGDFAHDDPPHACSLCLHDGFWSVISKAYGDHLKLSRNSEKVTESFVDTAMTIGGANSAGKQANKMTGSVNMSKRGHVALVHVEETAVEETEETEEPEEFEEVSGYRQIDKSLLWQCTHCRETFPSEFSCWQHVVSLATDRGHVGSDDRDEVDRWPW